MPQNSPTLAGLLTKFPSMSFYRNHMLPFGRYVLIRNDRIITCGFIQEVAEVYEFGDVVHVSPKTYAALAQERPDA